jgi:zinc protease
MKGLSLPAIIAIALAVTPASSAGTATPDAPSFEVIHYRLDNGLEVILQPDPTVTSAVVHVWYHVGSKDEVAGRTGFAHLFEHLMFEGSRHVAEGEFDVLLEKAGGWNNGTTNNDRTNYFEQVPANFLELALWLEADRMAGLWDAMNQGVLDNQRDVVKNERRQSYENRPYGMADLEVQQTLWPPGHGNHNLTIGTMEDLTAASLDDVEGFWRQWYRPSNATLVITGGIDVDATRELVTKYFAWMPTQERPQAKRLDSPVVPRDGAVALTAKDQVKAAKVILAWRTDAPHTEDAVDLAVAAQILGGGKTSRLYKRLVFRDRLASEVYAYQGDQMLGGELHIHAIARDGVDPETLRDAIREEVAALRETPASRAEVDRALRVLESSRLASLENIASRAEALAEWAAYTGDPDHLGEELEQLRAVTPQRLQTSVATWLAADAVVEMIVTPEGSK